MQQMMIIDEGVAVRSSVAAARGQPHVCEQENVWWGMALL